MNVLEAYLHSRDIKPAEFARRLNVSKSYFHEVLKGQKGASLDLAVKIEAETAGEVSCQALREIKTAAEEEARAEEASA